MFAELQNQKENLHHAYLIEGDREDVFNQLISFFEDILNFSVSNNPDFWSGEYDTFGIDDGRNINDLQNKKSFSETNSKLLGMGKKIFVIKTNFITREAQNSLLKMFEEPTENTHFFLVMNSGEVLLPTLKSRLMIIKSENSNISQDEKIKEFLKMSVGERLNFVQKFFDPARQSPDGSSRTEGGDSKKKIPADKIGAIEFLNNLEKVLHDKIDISKATEKDTFVFDEIIKGRSYLNDRSPLVKNILEHIALIVPENN